MSFLRQYPIRGVWHDPGMIYRALEVIQIFLAGERANTRANEGVPRGPRGPKNKHKDKGKDEDKDKVLKRPIMCYILETQGAQRFQI